MEYRDFEAVVLNLYEFFNYQNPAKITTIEKWFERVSHIPSAALPYIERMMQDQRDAMPRNVAKAFLAGWYQWQAANPQLIIRPRTACAGCGGKGFLWYASKNAELGGYVTRAAVCADCDNYQRTLGKIEGLRVTTRAGLEGQGFSVFPSDAYWRRVHAESEVDNVGNSSGLSGVIHGGRNVGDRGDVPFHDQPLL